MTVVNVPTGTYGEGDAIFEISHGLYPDSPADYVSFRVGFPGQELRGVGATRSNFLEAVEKAFDVTIWGNSTQNETSIHELTEALTASIPDRDKPWQPVVGAQIDAFWQLTRALRADAVLLDRDGEVWALDYDEDGTLYYVPATHETLDEGDPEGADITDLYPATIIYVRGQYTD